MKAITSPGNYARPYASVEIVFNSVNGNFTFPDDEYECNQPQVHRSKLTATSALRERGPENARLDGTCALACPSAFIS